MNRETLVVILMWFEHVKQILIYQFFMKSYVLFLISLDSRVRKIPIEQET